MIKYPSNIFYKALRDFLQGSNKLDCRNSHSMSTAPALHFMLSLGSIFRQ